MKLPFQFPLFSVTVLLTAAAFVVDTTAQIPQEPQRAAGHAPTPPPVRPSPTNLKVLPKDLTGDQVQEIMEQWKAGLSMDCNACHTEDRGKIDADGRPAIIFADDSKPEKGIARLMYTMTEEINQKFIAKVDGLGVPVTCGTCHRGHAGPEPFTNLDNQARPKPQVPQAGIADPLSDNKKLNQ